MNVCGESFIVAGVEVVLAYLGVLVVVCCGLVLGSWARREIVTYVTADLSRRRAP